ARVRAKPRHQARESLPISLRTTAMAAKTMAPNALRDAASAAVSAGNVLIELLAKARPPLIMGVLNVTPDSFSDGGRFLEPTAAIEHGRALIAEGADIVDVGGESTRPGGQEVSAQQELAR